MSAKQALFGFALAIMASAVQAQTVRITGTSDDDVLTVHAENGEPRIVQKFENAGTGDTGPNGEELRADDENDPLYSTSRLDSTKFRAYFGGQPFKDPTKTMSGGAGADVFNVRTYISGKPAIVALHVNDDFTIDWAGVAGENNNVHDHWPDSFGAVEILDYSAAQGDEIIVEGHTVALHSIRRKGRGSLITVQSQQGDGGGAHDEDILGTIYVKNTRVTEDDITFISNTDGITETFFEFLDLADYYYETAYWLRGNQTQVRRWGLTWYMRYGGELDDPQIRGFMSFLGF